MDIDLLPSRIRFDRSGKERVIVDENGCWIWLGAISGLSGHGTIRVDDKQHLVHRLVYSLLVGDPGPLLHHRCEVPACFHPDPEHLQPLAGRFEHSRHHVADRCRKGHLLTHSNTYLVSSEGRRPYRQCKLCRAAARRAHRERTGN